MRRAGICLAVALLGGCGGRKEAPAGASAVAVTDWRRAATPADRARLRAWRTTWLEAVGLARAEGAGPELTAQAPLFDPDAALPDPVPPAGDYRCRVFKLGARRAGTRHFTAYPSYLCQIEAGDGQVHLRKIGGSQRPFGRIYPDETGRAVFLGTMLLSDEARPIDYGRDAARDMAGFVQRIGPARWRVAFPQPAFESMLDVIELVPEAR